MITDKTEISEEEFFRIMYSRIQEYAEKTSSVDVIDRIKGKTRFSSLDLAEIADEMRTSVHYLITGERDPWEVKISHCTDSTKGGLG